ncbi:MAG: protein kinase [Clostridia bacterium]|nr:protein kinase [Clostridia bacterium]
MSEAIHGYETTEEWHQANEGRWMRVVKNGKSYFLKQYTNIAVEPDKSKIGTVFSQTVYDKKLEEFNLFQEKKAQMNRSLKSIAGSGGNIVIPLDSFVHDHYYTEISDFYSSPLSPEEIVALAPEQKQTLMRTLTSTLKAIHRLKIVHGDIKDTNVICTKNAIGKYVLKLIDFGASFFVNEKSLNPEDYSGDPCYASPELGLVWMSEDAETDPTEYIEKLSEKTDIFSFGLLLHFFLTGKRPLYTNIDLEAEFPGKDPAVIYPFEVLLQNGKLELSPEITDPRYLEILPRMLDADPDKRPTATEVLNYLNRTQKLAKTDGEKADKPTATEKAYGKKSAKTGDVSPAPSPSLTGSGIDEPWEEDGIRWASNLTELMTEEGYTKIKRERNFLGQNVYSFYKVTGSKVMRSADWVLEKGFATVARLDTTGFGNDNSILREEDATRFRVNTELLISMNSLITPAERHNAFFGKSIEGYELINTACNTKVFYPTPDLVRFKILL